MPRRPLLAKSMHTRCDGSMLPRCGGTLFSTILDRPGQSRRLQRLLGAMVRGGSWLTGVDKARAAARYRNTPGSRNADNGFRVVVSGEVPRATPGVAPPVPPQSAGAAVDSSSPQGSASFTYSSTPHDSAQDSASTGSNGSDSGDTGLGWFLLLGGLGAAGAIMVARGRSRRRQPSAHAFLSVRPVDDGFWIDRPLPPGTRVQWSARLGGAVQTGQSDATGGPLFVYTGQRPEDVRASVLGSGGRSAAASRRTGVSGNQATSSGAADAWAQQAQDAHAQATMAAMAYHAASESSHHGTSESSMSSGSTSEPFSGWPSAY
jgi:sulfatase modifying factor 1